MQPDTTILIIHLQLCNLQLATHNCTFCTFSHLFLQLVATTTSTGDKSGKRPQNLSCYNEYFIIFL